MFRRTRTGRLLFFYILQVNLLKVRKKGKWQILPLTRFYRPAFVPGLVPGALTGYDLPDLAASLAPRTLVIAGMTNGNGHPADAEIGDKELDVVRMAYQNIGALSRLKIAADDPDLAGTNLIQGRQLFIPLRKQPLNRLEMRQKDDYLWKGILENVLDDFLRFVHPDADQILDLSKGIRFLDKELEQLFPPEGNQYSPKVVDKLAQVYTRQGNEEWVLLHVEVQDSYRKDFPFRMFNYYYRILDKYQKRISAYAIFTGAGPKDGADTYEEEFMRTSIRYRFNTFKIMDQEEGELLRSNNPFALVALIAKATFAGKRVKDTKARDHILLEIKLNLLREMLSKEIPKNKIRGLINFLTYYIHFH